ncbi:MAG: M1 family aminopeptidase, partial [Ardenticatenaceae bacterium]
CYELDFSLAEAGDTFEAMARATIRNDTGDSWPYLLFRLYPESPLLFGGDIEVEYVTVSGIAVEWERVLEDETGLQVPLSTPLAPGGTVPVEIAFRGFLSDLSSDGAGGYGIFARARHSVTLASWFPLLAVWNEAADEWYNVPVLGQGDAVFTESALIEATLSAPERYELAVSGLVVEQRAVDGQSIHRVVTGPARDLAMVWMEGYEREELQVGDTTLRNWYRPGDEEGAARALEAAREALALFNESFGPYPFEELDVVEAPLEGAGGVEYPQLYLLDEFLYRDENSHDFLAFASAHEMAHQWWYYVVGNDINAAPWQDEALTNWSAVFWMEQSAGETRAEEYLQSIELAVGRFEEERGKEAIAQPLARFVDRSDAYGTIVYLKGALFFAALREEIGDDAFFDALQDYYADNFFEITTPAGLLERFETTSGRALDEFYERWGVMAGN